MKIGVIRSKHFEQPEQSRNLGPFVKRLKVTTVNTFCHFVINKNNKMCPKCLFNLDMVNLRCCLLGKLQFVFLVVWGHQRLVNMILFTFSPTTVAYIKPQRTCKSSALDELLGPVHCLKGVFEKATAPPQTETISRYRKALCTTVLGLFSHLKILEAYLS